MIIMKKNVRNLHTRQTKSSFARFARAFFIFVYFIAVLVLSATCALFKTFVQLFIFDYLETAHTNLFPGDVAPELVAHILGLNPYLTLRAEIA